MSVPTAETTTPSLGATDPVSAAPDRVRLGGWRLYGLMLGVALAIAALSLLIPSTPSYDPWSWLVWGREIEHFGLHLPGGPTWKPLPVIFTTLLAPFGSAQPDLWLVIARAGAVMAVLMTFKLAARLTWWLRSGDLAAAARGGERLAALAPALLAGAIAAVGLALSGNLISDGALGYSEGLLSAATLMAVELHLDGHRHQAFVLGFVAALGRPEVWVFWGPYGLWLMWKDPSSRKLVIGLGLLTLFLWFVPQKWGGGSFTQGVSRAQHPRKNSAAFASCPFCTELADHAWPLVLLRLKVAAALTALSALAVLGVVLRRRPGLIGWSALKPGGRIGLDRRERALLTIAACGAFGLAWWVLIALETQAGFSGNDRYLVLGSSFVEICGAAGFGWGAFALGRWIARIFGRRARAFSRPALTVGAASALSGLVFLAAPNWVGANLIDLSRTHRSLVYQATLRTDVAALIAHDGGAKRMVACGSVMTEGFQVPMVAWYLGLRTIQVLDQPPVGPGSVAGFTDANGKFVKIAPPATILQTRDTRHAALLPEPATIVAWEHQGAHYRFERTRAIYFFQDCRK